MPLVSKAFGDIITFTRASTATYFDATGTLQSAAIDAPRFDYDPATLAAQGLLIEEARTNSIRNNTAQGAVAGTPGTLPTDWNVIGSGLTANVIGTGTEAGINYIDIQLVGTTTGGSSGIRFEATNQIVAASGQSWSGSFYVRSVGGSTANLLTMSPNIGGRTSANAANTDNSAGTNFLSSLSATNISNNRRTNSITLADATTAFVFMQLLNTHNVGVAIDITLRIGLPQLEQGAFATSVIPTTTTALTRSADVGNVNTLAPWYNSTAGTVYSEFVINSTAPTSGFPTAASFNNGTTNNRINPAYLNDAINALDYFVSDGGVAQVGLSSITYTAGNVAKMAAAYATNDFALSTNGGAVLTDTSGTVPSVTALNLGNQLGGNFLNGYLRRVSYFPRRLSNAELQSLTA